METDNTRQRGAISAMVTTPIAAPANTTPACANPDAAILEAWHARQAALAEIEANGAYYDCDGHSPDATAAYDRADIIVIESKPQTVDGVTLKLLALMPVMADMSVDEAKLARRGDVEGLLAMKGADYVAHILAEVVIALRQIGGAA